MTDKILVQRDGAIATVVLNRPRKLNALDRQIWAQLGREERDQSQACFDTEDYRIGVEAFLANKQPEFRGR